MLDLVLYCTAISLAGVTPVVLGDERLLRVVGGQVWGAREIEAELVPPVGVEPLIRGASTRRARPDLMAHRNREVVLVVDRSRDPGDRAPGGDFLDENHTAPPTIFRLAANVESQVELLEIAVPGDRKSPNPGIEKTESDDAHESTAIPGVELGSPRN